MRSKSNGNSAIGMESSLTAEGLKACMERVKLSPPKPKVCVVSHRTKAQLDAQKLGVVKLRPEAIFGSIEMYVKDQAAACWAFTDREVMRKYLDGELSELDLMQLALGDNPGILKVEGNSAMAPDAKG